jgi:hypothetical protein
MRRFICCIIGLTALLAVLLTQGCLLFVAGAAAGAAVGGVSYVGNELRATVDATVDRTWSAAHAAMKEMEYAVISGETRKDAAGGKLQGRNARDQRVVVQLFRQTDKTAEVRIRVGEFDTAANKAAAQAFYDKLKARL